MRKASGNRHSLPYWRVFANYAGSCYQATIYRVANITGVIATSNHGPVAAVTAKDEPKGSRK